MAGEAFLVLFFMMPPFFLAERLQPALKLPLTDAAMFSD